MVELDAPTNGETVGFVPLTNLISVSFKVTVIFFVHVTPVVPQGTFSL